MLNGNGADLYYVILDIHYTIQYKSISSISSLSLYISYAHTIYIYIIHYLHIHRYKKHVPWCPRSLCWRSPPRRSLRVWCGRLIGGFYPKQTGSFARRFLARWNWVGFSCFCWFLRCFFAILLIEIDKLKDFFWDLRTGEIRENWNLRVFFAVRN